MPCSCILLNLVGMKVKIQQPGKSFAMAHHERSTEHSLQHETFIQCRSCINLLSFYDNSGQQTEINHLKWSQGCRAQQQTAIKILLRHKSQALLFCRTWLFRNIAHLREAFRSVISDFHCTMKFYLKIKFSFCFVADESSDSWSQ